MNRHTRLVVSVLFFVIIVFSISLTRSYFDGSKDTADAPVTVEIVRRLEEDSAGNMIFEGSGGLYGIVDPNNRVVAAPEWNELQFAQGGRCIASKRIGGKLLWGCIDYDGNIVVPFIYSSISRYNSGGCVFYSAKSAADSSCVIYGEDFTPCFRNSWEKVQVSGSDVQLVTKSAELSFTAGENGLVCKKAAVSGEVLNCGFTVNMYSRILLSKLDCPTILAITDAVEKYIEYAYTDDRSVLGAMEERGIFTPLFPNEEKVTSKKLLGITDIFIFSEKSDSGIQCYNAAITADTRITYINEKGETSSLEAPYRASVKFYSDAAGVTAVSGEFRETAPDYPQETEDIPEDGAETAQELSEVSG